MLLSILGIREGGIKNLAKEKINRQVKFLNRSNSVLSHMLHFANAVSEELEEKSHRLEHIANTDKLTDIYNRRAIEEQLGICILQAKNKYECLSVLLLDLDNFKHINDSFGHLVGDAALMQVAALIKENIPFNTYVGRWGGDEFLVILPNTSAMKACDVGEKIRRAVENSTMEGGALKLTVSIGVARYCSSDNIDTLFGRADKSMYMAKTKFNKNNVQFIDE